jgi:type I restriction enzyme S subunit
MEATASLQQVRQFRLQHGDVIITKDSETPEDIGMPAFVEEGADDLVCGYHLAVIRPDKTQVDGRFLCYVMRSKRMREHLGSLARGVTRFGLRIDDIGSVQFECPALSNQRCIADFLDRETARIDALIAKKRQLIEVLTSRRQVLIESAFGGGRGPVEYFLASNGNAEGQVPMKRLLSRTIAGGTPDSGTSYYWAEDPEGAAWVAIGDMEDLGKTSMTARRISSEGLSAVRLKVSPPGTLLFAMYASLGKLTVTAVPAVWNQAILGLVPAEQCVDARFLALWLEVLRPHLSLIARSSTQSNLNAEQVGELPIPYLPVAKQVELVERLHPQLENMQNIAQRLRQHLPVLREYRQALIEAAVTGELKVAA